MQIEFTEHGYRQLARAIADAAGPPTAEPSPDAGEALQVDVEPWADPTGLVAYLDSAGMHRWITPDLATRVPAAWRKLYVAKPAS
jgi:hypothetical protein